MNKKYIFVFLIFLMLYLLYSILDLKYETYKENKIKEKIIYENKILLEKTKKIKEKEIPYRRTKAFEDKLAKQTSKYKNPWEDFFLIVEEKSYEKYHKPLIEEIKQEKIKEEKIYDTMTIYEKWIYFIFNKDIRED